MVIFLQLFGIITPFLKGHAKFMIYLLIFGIRFFIISTQRKTKTELQGFIYFRFG
jgi:hypothetical protein